MDLLVSLCMVKRVWVNERGASKTTKKQKRSPFFELTVRCKLQLLIQEARFQSLELIGKLFKEATGFYMTTESELTVLGGLRNTRRPVIACTRPPAA